jgi:hypothetical protein
MISIACKRSITSKVISDWPVLGQLAAPQRGVRAAETQGLLFSRIHRVASAVYGFSATQSCLAHGGERL